MKTILIPQQPKSIPRSKCKVLSPDPRLLERGIHANIQAFILIVIGVVALAEMDAKATHDLWVIICGFADKY